MDKKKIISSLIYKSFERLSVKGLGLVISIVLARMLAPEDFGQIAIMTVFINLSQVIVESGFTTALVQRNDVNERDYSTVFYINIALATVCFIVLQISAPLISAYYHQNITLPLQVYAFSIFLGAFNALQLARMQKRMQFKKMMVCSLIATVISGIVGIAAAYCGLGLWALILYNMVNSVIMCITATLAEKWFPKFEFSLDRAKILYSYGWKMFVSALLCSLYGDLRSLIIGKKFSGNDLAYYNRGQQFPQVISHTMDSAIQSVMFPTMASVQDEKEKLAQILRNTVSMGTYIIVPTMFGLAAVSEAVIQLLLTDKWLPCVPYMQWLCLSNAAVPIISSNLIALKASGRSDIYMRLEILRRIVMLVILLSSILLFNFVEAIAVSCCISSWLDAFISMYPIKHLLDYGAKKQMADLWKSVASALIMFVAVQAMSVLLCNPIILLMVQIFVGVVLYVALGYLLKNETQKNIAEHALAIIKRNTVH